MLPQEKSQVDVLIIGSGLVGNSLALALADHAKIAMIEATPANSIQPTDERTLALSFATRRIFQALGIWEKIQPYTTAIQQIHVSEAGLFGATRFLAQDYQLDALGYVILARHLTDTLKQCVLEKNSLTQFFSSVPLEIQAFPEGYRVNVQTPEGLHAFTTRLLIGADGTQSWTRQLLGISAKQKDYQQTALTAHITLARRHQHIAYERFTQKGVLAALPLPKQQIGIIWTVNTDQSTTLQCMTNEDFCAAFQTTFGYRLGKFLHVDKRQAYTLKGLEAAQQIQPHALLLGNAAHTLHPVAAQGFNLGLRDAAAVAQVVIDAMTQGKNPGDFKVLQHYENWRKQEQFEVINLTNTLVRLFSKHHLLINRLKEMGFLSLDMLPFVKNWMAHQTMGIANPLPPWVTASA